MTKSLLKSSVCWYVPWNTKWLKDAEMFNLNHANCERFKKTSIFNGVLSPQVFCFVTVTLNLTQKIYLFLKNSGNRQHQRLSTRTKCVFPEQTTFMFNMFALMFTLMHLYLQTCLHICLQTCLHICLQMYTQCWHLYWTMFTFLYIHVYTHVYKNV